MIEICIGIEVDYSKIMTKFLPREVMMIENEKIKEFINFCFLEDNVDSILAHGFLKNDEGLDSLPVKLIPVEDF